MYCPQKGHILLWKGNNEIPLKYSTKSIFESFHQFIKNHKEGSQYHIDNIDRKWGMKYNRHWLLCYGFSYGSLHKLFGYCGFVFWCFYICIVWTHNATNKSICMLCTLTFLKMLNAVKLGSSLAEAEDDSSWSSINSQSMYVESWLMNKTDWWLKKVH